MLRDDAEFENWLKYLEILNCYTLNAIAAIVKNFTQLKIETFL